MIEKYNIEKDYLIDVLIREPEKNSRQYLWPKQIPGFINWAEEQKTIKELEQEANNNNWYKIAQENISDFTEDDYINKINPTNKYHNPGLFNYTVEELNDSEKTKEQYPILLQTKEFQGDIVEFRQSGEKLKYVKHTSETYKFNGETYVDDRAIARDENGDVIYLSEEEMKERNLPTEDEGITAFIGDQEVGYIGDSFGATELFVAKEYQQRGVGSELVYLFLKKYPFKQSGGFSSLGEKTYRNVYKRMLEESQKNK